MSPVRSLGEVRRAHPPFVRALLADARITAAHRGERHVFRSRSDAAIQALRLMWASDAFAAQALYRAKARLQALGVPALPRLLHRLAMVLAQVSIGDPVLVRPGVYIVHGQVVIDGLTEVRSGTVISPFATVGLRAPSFQGPTIGPRARIGSGARVLGAIEIGADARVGANAVVLDDVPAERPWLGYPRDGFLVRASEGSFRTKAVGSFSSVSATPALRGQ